MIRYVTEKWGDDRVAQIITYAPPRPRPRSRTRPGCWASLRARRPDHQGVPARRDGQGHPRCPGFDEAHPRVRGGLRDPCPRTRPRPRCGRSSTPPAARGADPPGRARDGCDHGSEPIIDHVPVWKREADGAVITQFDYPACESLGLLKMDFLGLRNLDRAGRRGSRRQVQPGTDIDLETLALDDKPTYDLLARGDTLGIFQFDGGPMRALLPQVMRPDNFEDISAGRRAVPARPDGRQRAQRLRRPQETTRKPVVPHPSPSWPPWSCWPTSWATPTG